MYGNECVFELNWILKVVQVSIWTSFLISSPVPSPSPALALNAVWRWTLRSWHVQSMHGSSWIPATSTCPSVLRTGSSVSPYSTMLWVITGRKLLTACWVWGNFHNTFVPSKRLEEYIYLEGDFGLIGCILLSFPWSSPVCPRYVRIALKSFQGLTLVSPKCPACGTGHLGLARGAWRHHVRATNRSISSFRRLTAVSTAGSTRGSLSNAPIVGSTESSLILVSN